MNILMCLNSHYMYPMLATLHSLRRYNQDEVDLYLLSTNFSKEAADILAEHCEQLKIGLHIIKAQLPGFAGRSRFTPDMFLRCFAFKLLPQDVDKVLYIDADMIFLNNVKKLYDVDVSKVKLACVRDSNSDCTWFGNYVDKITSKEWKIQHEYFNSGMLLMNLKTIRNSWGGGEERFQKIVDDVQPLFPDQDLLNLVCKSDDIIFLRSIFNCQKTHHCCRVGLKNVVILHYVGPHKPWTVHLLKKHEKLFWEVMRPLGITRKVIKDFNSRN